MVSLSHRQPLRSGSGWGCEQMRNEKNPLAVTISRRLKTMMAARGMTSADLVRRTTIGGGQISNYLHGNFTMRVDKLLELCETLDCSADYLMGRTNNPKVAGR